MGRRQAAQRGVEWSLAERRVFQKMAEQAGTDRLFWVAVAAGSFKYSVGSLVPVVLLGRDADDAYVCAPLEPAASAVPGTSYTSPPALAASLTAPAAQAAPALPAPIYTVPTAHLIPRQCVFHEDGLVLGAPLAGAASREECVQTLAAGYPLTNTAEELALYLACKERVCMAAGSSLVPLHHNKDLLFRAPGACSLPPAQLASLVAPLAACQQTLFLDDYDLSAQIVAGVLQAAGTALDPRLAAASPRDPARTNLQALVLAVVRLIALVESTYASSYTNYRLEAVQRAGATGVQLTSYYLLPANKIPRAVSALFSDVGMELYPHLADLLMHGENDDQDYRPGLGLGLGLGLDPAPGSLGALEHMRGSVTVEATSVVFQSSFRQSTAGCYGAAGLEKRDRICRDRASCNQTYGELNALVYDIVEHGGCGSVFELRRTIMSALYGFLTTDINILPDGRFIIMHTLLQSICGYVPAFVGAAAPTALTRSAALRTRPLVCYACNTLKTSRLVSSLKARMPGADDADVLRLLASPRFDNKVALFVSIQFVVHTLFRDMAVYYDVPERRRAILQTIYLVCSEQPRSRSVLAFALSDAFKTNVSLTQSLRRSGRLDDAARQSVVVNRIACYYGAQGALCVRSHDGQLFVISVHDLMVFSRSHALVLAPVYRFYMGLDLRRCRCLVSLGAEDVGRQCGASLPVYDYVFARAGALRECLDGFAIGSRSLLAPVLLSAGLRHTVTLLVAVAGTFLVLPPAVAGSRALDVPALLRQNDLVFYTYGGFCFVSRTSGGRLVAPAERRVVEETVGAIARYVREHEHAGAGAHAGDAQPPARVPDTVHDAPGRDVEEGIDMPAATVVRLRQFIESKLYLDRGSAGAHASFAWDSPAVSAVGAAALPSSSPAASGARPARQRPPSPP